MKNIKDLTTSDVIHCPTEQQATMILELADKAGYRWNTEEKYTEKNRWNQHKETTCYRVVSGTYGPTCDCEGKYIIHKAKDFLLPEKWSIKITEENFSVLTSYYNKQCNTNLYDALFINYYLHSHNHEDESITDNSNDLQTSFTSHDSYFPEISFDVFKEFILNNNEMDKKIIGYKCPTDLYGGQVKAGTIFKSTSSSPTTTPIYIAVDGKGNIIKSHFELPKEIVETWEPVYKEEVALYVVRHDVSKEFVVTIKKDGIHMDGKLIFNITDLNYIIDNFDNVIKYTGYTIKTHSIDIGCRKNISLEVLREIVKIHSTL